MKGREWKRAAFLVSTVMFFLIWGIYF
jgi:hypothetical protein